MTEPNDAPDSVASSNNPSNPSADAGRIGWKLSLVVCLAILLAGGGVLGFIFYTQPEATRAGATKETAMLVDVMSVEAGTYRPSIVATGTVRPARQIVIRPRVEGQVIAHAESLVPGGLVEAGETLVRLDPADYEHNLRQRRNELDQALAQLRIEKGRQRVAQNEYELVDQQLSGENRALVLREPQLDSAQSSVASARAAVDRAQLDLQRTTIQAPFDAQVLSREIDVGSQVAVGDALAQLVGTGTYWVETTVPVSKLQWLIFPDTGDAPGSEVRIHNAGAWPEGVYRSGRLFRLVGSLDDATRMARVLVAVDDPLALGEAAAGKPRLLLGTYVEARVAGQRLSGVVRLPREYVHRNDSVWVMADGELDIREVDIAVRDSEYAYIRDGLSSGERVVTSSLATIQDGAPLRLDGEASPSETAGDGEAVGTSGSGG